MSFTFFSLITLSIMVVLVLSQVYSGYKRGVTRSLIGLALIVITAFAAVPISTSLASVLEPELTLVLEELEFYRAVLYSLGSVASAMSLLLRMAIALILYLPVFAVLRCVLSIVFFIVCKVVFRKMGRSDINYYKENEELYVKKNKRVGALVGVASGIIMTVVVLTPIVGAVRSVDDIIEVVAKFTEDDSFLENDEVKMLTESADDASAVVLGVCGSDMLCDFVTTVEVDGQRAALSDEIALLKDFDVERVNFVLTSLNTASADSSEYLEELLSYLKGSVVLKTVVVVYVNDASRAWMNGEAYMGIEKPTFGTHGALDEFMNVIFYVCSTSTLDTIDDDITTLMNMSRIFNERRSVFESGDYNTMITELVDSGTLDLIRSEFDKNAHMRAVSYAIEDMVMTIVSEELKNSLKYTTEEYEELFTEFADILVATQGLSGSVRASAVSADIKERFVEYGIYVPEELNDTIANLLIGEVTSADGQPGLEDVQSFFNQYNVAEPEQ